MQCPECNGTMEPSHNRCHERCRACGHHEFHLAIDDPNEPLEPLGQPVGVLCPKCELPLEFANLHERWKVCLCLNCRGYVIEKGAMAVIVHEKRANYRGQDATPVPLNPLELEEHRSCPACLETMETHPYFGPGTAVINSCQGCQVTWLDHGELAGIICAPGKRPSPDSSPVVPQMAPRVVDPYKEVMAETGVGMLRALRHFL